MQEKQDWLNLQEEKRKSRPAQEDSRTHRMAQLLVGRLTTHEHCNVFQEYAASNIARLEMIVESYKAPLLSHTVVSNDDLMQAKIGLHAHQAALEVYQDMLNYPDRFTSVETDSQK